MANAFQETGNRKQETGDSENPAPCQGSRGYFSGEEESGDRDQETGRTNCIGAFLSPVSCSLSPDWSAAVRDLHPEPQAALFELGLHFSQGRLAEVADFEEFVL